MKMDGDVMRMREVKSIDLPKGKDGLARTRRLPHHADESGRSRSQPAMSFRSPWWWNQAASGRQSRSRSRRAHPINPCSIVTKRPRRGSRRANASRRAARRRLAGSATGSGWRLSAAICSSAARPLSVPGSSSVSSRAVNALISLNCTVSSASRNTSSQVSAVRLCAAARCGAPASRSAGWSAPDSAAARLPSNRPSH